MGANIHAHIEVKAGGRWHHYAAPIVERDYQLFAAISGERIDDLKTQARPKPVSKHAALPKDISEITRLSLENDRDRYGLHGFGYLETPEIEKLQEQLYSLHPEVKRTGIDELDLEYAIFHTYINGSTIAHHPGYDDARIVYWYDN